VTYLKTCIDACISRRGQFFTSKQIEEKNSLNRDSVRRALQRLVREGHLVRYHQERGTLTYKKGRPSIESIVYLAMPSLKKRKASRTNIKQKNTAWDRMWKAMRVLRKFKKKDIVMTAGVERENAGYFMKMLRRGKYLSVDKAGSRHATWTLIDDVGPERPSLEEMRVRSKGEPR
jgi:transcription initiation factor IIE alpha subunit